MPDSKIDQKNLFFTGCVMLFTMVSIFACILIAACGPNPFFMPVMEITGVPVTGTAGVPLVLSGTPQPGFATNRSIVWTLQNAETGGAELNGNVLTTGAEGKVLIRADIARGGPGEMTYTQYFSIVFTRDAEAITEIALTITGPVLGQVPAATAAGTGRFTAGAVSWQPADNPFKAGTVYTASVTLTADTGCMFTERTSATVNGQAAVISGSPGTAVTVTYTFARTFDKGLDKIAVKIEPNKMTYNSGEALDLSGLVVTLTYEDDSTEDAAFADFDSKGITATPAHGTALSYTAHNGKPVVISAGGRSDDTGYLTVGKANFTVSFNSDGGSTVPGQTVSEGDKISEPANPRKTGFAFDGWYKEAALVNKWDFGTDTVSGNTTLYAKWLANQGITFEFNPDESPELTVASGIAIHRSGANGNTTATIAVGNAGVYDASPGIGWYYNDILLGTGASFTLDSSDSRYNMIGIKFIRVEASIGGVPYITNIEFEVKP
jgi:uncharacterized repeat protein (TIGR02543 family)